MFHCPGTSSFISLPQTEVESVPIDLGEPAEISSQLESGILLRLLTAPTGFRALGFASSPHRYYSQHDSSCMCTPTSEKPATKEPGANWEGLTKYLSTREPKRSHSIPVIGLNLRNTDDGRLMSARNLYKSSSLRRSPSCWVLERKLLSTQSFQTARERVNHLILQPLSSGVKMYLPRTRC